MPEIAEHRALTEALQAPSFQQTEAVEACGKDLRSHLSTGQSLLQHYK